MDLMSKILDWVMARVVLILVVIVVLLSFALTIQVYRAKAIEAGYKSKIAELNQIIDGFVVASNYQQAKVNEAAARSDKDYKTAIRDIKTLADGPMPKTPEEAKEWSLKALQGRGK